MSNSRKLSNLKRKRFNSSSSNAEEIQDYSNDQSMGSHLLTRSEQKVRSGHSVFRVAGDETIEIDEEFLLAKTFINEDKVQAHPEILGDSVLGELLERLENLEIQIDEMGEKIRTLTSLADFQKRLIKTDKLDNTDTTRIIEREKRLDDSLLKEAISMKKEGNLELAPASKTELVAALPEKNKTMLHDVKGKILPTKKYKSRLILGEGNFSYSKSLINKHKDNHPTLAEHLTATELAETLTPEAQENIEYLRSKNTTVVLGVDATNIEAKFSDDKYKRIHFNCPYAGKSQTTRQVIKNFFNSAKKKQSSHDRIHMALVDAEFEQVGYYDIVKASTAAGYELIKKRKFDTERYPEYEHTKTAGGTPSKKLHLLKEFIFEKSEKNSDELTKEYQKKNWLSDGNYTYKTYDSNQAPFFNKQVDETESSSSYEDNDSEVTKNAMTNSFNI